MINVVSIKQELDGTMTVEFDSVVDGIGGATSSQIQDTTQSVFITWSADFSGTIGVGIPTPLGAVSDTYVVSAGVDASLSGVTLGVASDNVSGTSVNVLSIDTTPLVIFDQNVSTLPLAAAGIDINDGNTLTWVGESADPDQQGVCLLPVGSGQPYTVAGGPDSSIYGVVLVASSGTISGD